MNKKTIYFFVALVLLILDVALSGKFQSLKFFLIFPIPYFLISVREKMEDIIVPGLVYGFLFDIASLGKIPFMTIFVLIIIALSWFLKGKFVDISQSINLFIFSIFLSVAGFMFSSLLYGNILTAPYILRMVFYNVLASSVLFLISNSLINRFLHYRVDEKV